MPRTKSIKTVIAGIVVYAGVCVVVGYLCENLTEWFIMQSELTSMKSDLNSLGMNLNYIEMAYDNLRDDIQDIVLTTKMDSKSIDPYTPEIPNTKPTYKTYIVSKPTNTDSKGIFNKLADAQTNYETKTKDFMQNFEIHKKDFMQVCTVPVRDKSTVTEARAVKYVDAGNSGNDITDIEKIDICKYVDKFISSEVETKNEIHNQDNKDFKYEVSLAAFPESSEQTQQQ